MRYSPPLLILGSCLVLASSSLASPMVLPPETVTLKPGPGADLATAHCLICHSAEYMSTMPIFPRTYWQTSVAKMVSKFGAPIPKEQVEPLVDYLVRHYGDERPGAEPARAPSPEKKGP